MPLTEKDLIQENTVNVFKKEWYLPKIRAAQGKYPVQLSLAISTSNALLKISHDVVFQAFHVESEWMK